MPVTKNKNLGNAAFFAIKGLKKDLETLTATQALRDRELDLFFNTVSAMTDKLRNLEDRIGKAEEQIRKEDIRTTEKSEGNL